MPLLLLLWLFHVYAPDQHGKQIQLSYSIHSLCPHALGRTALFFYSKTHFASEAASTEGDNQLILSFKAEVATGGLYMSSKTICTALVPHL